MAEANIRLGAGCILLGAGSWWALLQPGFAAWTLILVAWLAALGSFVAFFRGRRQLRGAPDCFLELGDSEMIVATERTTTTVPWGEVEAVVVDEELLCVRVQRTNQQEDLVIRSRYRNTGVYALQSAIHTHWKRAQQRGDQRKSAPRPHRS
ncbi:MAG: hypothetical protein AAF550_10300 [Myxococcota bacterium]